MKIGFYNAIEGKNIEIEHKWVPRIDPGPCCMKHGRKFKRVQRRDFIQPGKGIDGESGLINMYGKGLEGDGHFQVKKLTLCLQIRLPYP